MYKSIVIALTATAATPAFSAEVVLGGVVANACIINTTAGTLGSEGDGTSLSTEGLAGVPATVGVVATGGTPTLRFTAPTLSTPAGFSGTPDTRMSVANGATLLQPLTGSASTAALGRLVGTLTVRAKVTSSDGFAAGIYTVRSTVTCEQ